MILPTLKLLSLIILSILIGCSPPQVPNQPVTDQQMAHQPETKPEVAHSAEIIVDKHSVKNVAKPHPKPGAGVSFENTTPHVLQQNVPEDVLLVLLASGAEGVMDVRITVSEGLTLNSQNTIRFELLPNGRYELPVNITAHQQGRHYINLQVLTNINKRQATRALAAVVQVGNELQLQKNQGLAPSSATDDGVVIMPAEETIIP